MAGELRVYRPKESSTVKAVELEEATSIGGEEFQAGDYLVMDGSGVSGAKKEEFEKLYEAVGHTRKPMSEETKAKLKAAHAARKAAAEQAQAAPATS